ncbi:MAG: hypothetical protein ACLFRS_11370, partial [Halomonas sp.]
MTAFKTTLALLLVVTLSACASWTARSDRASELRPGETHYGQLASGLRLYRLEVERPGTLTLEAATPVTRTAPGGFSGRLLDEAGAELAADRRSGQGENFRFEEALEPGTYYLEMRNDTKCSSNACTWDNMHFKLESRLR